MIGFCHSCQVAAEVPVCHTCGAQVAVPPSSGQAPPPYPANPPQSGQWGQPGWFAYAGPQAYPSYPGDPGHRGYHGYAGPQASPSPPLQGPAPAPVGLRIGTFVLDLVIINILTFAVAFMAGFTAVFVAPGISDAALENLGLALGLAMAATYFVLPTALTGRTAGKWMTGIKVVRRDGVSRPGFGVALGRWLLLLLMTLICYIPAIICAVTMGNEPLKRGWHDRAVGTMVIHTR